MTGLICDLFSGGGGASLGISLALGRPVDVAINHSPEAIAMHARNHPTTLHLQDDVWNVDMHRDIPSGPVELAWLSPSCTSHSRVRGSKPKDDQSRALPWVAVSMAKARKPRILAMENVCEWQHWGPLDEEGHALPGTKGDTFRQFVWRLETLGYVVEWRTLRACDYGAPTSRQRLFLVARRDGLPIVWPAPTHGPGLLPFRAALECLDFSLPCPNVEGQGLSAPVKARVVEGLRRYVTEGDPVMRDGAAWFGVVRGFGERVGQAPRTWDLRRPLGTVVAGSVKHALARVYDGQIGMRMLTPRELARAQGFPDSYLIPDHTGDAVMRLGNSVSPPLAAALVAANVPRKKERAA